MPLMTFVLLLSVLPFKFALLNFRARNRDNTAGQLFETLKGRFVRGLRFWHTLLSLGIEVKQ